MGAHLKNDNTAPTEARHTAGLFRVRGGEGFSPRMLHARRMAPSVARGRLRGSRVAPGLRDIRGALYGAWRCWTPRRAVGRHLDASIPAKTKVLARYRILSLTLFFRI